MHEAATDKQIADTPVGTLAHRNYICPSLEGERIIHAPNAMRQRADRFAKGNLAFARALHPSIDRIVPPPAVDATFTWHVAPLGGYFVGRVYSDGSRLDGPTPLLGWAFVVLGDDNSIIASAFGVPPDWVEDIPGTEAWALTEAAIYALPGCTFFVDCEPCVKAVHAGSALSCADNKPLARVHKIMHIALGDVPGSAVIWMPARLRPGQCGSVTRGDGFLLTEPDVVGNAEADKLAKRAVEHHRVPFRVRQEIKAHDELVTSNATWIARAGILANQQSGDPERDTQASRAKAAAAAAAKRQFDAQTTRARPTELNPQTGKRSTTRGKQPSDGGHVLQRRGAGWWCSVQGEVRGVEQASTSDVPRACCGHMEGKGSHAGEGRGHRRTQALQPQPQPQPQQQQQQQQQQQP